MRDSIAMSVVAVARLEDSRVQVLAAQILARTPRRLVHPSSQVDQGVLEGRSCGLQ